MLWKWIIVSYSLKVNIVVYWKNWLSEVSQLCMELNSVLSKFALISKDVISLAWMTCHSNLIWSQRVPLALRDFKNYSAVLVSLISKTHEKNSFACGFRYLQRKSSKKWIWTSNRLINFCSIFSGALTFEIIVKLLCSVWPYAY